MLADMLVLCMYEVLRALGGTCEHLLVCSVVWEATLGNLGGMARVFQLWGVMPRVPRPGGLAAYPQAGMEHGVVLCTELRFFNASHLHILKEWIIGSVLSLCLKCRFAETKKKKQFQQRYRWKLYLFSAPFPLFSLALVNHVEGTITASAESPAKARFLRASVPLLYSFVNFLTYLVGCQTPMQLMSIRNIYESFHF